MGWRRFSPSLQLLLGVWLFHEPFGQAKLIGFVFIWAGLALVSADALKNSGAQR